MNKRKLSYFIWLGFCIFFLWTAYHVFPNPHGVGMAMWFAGLSLATAGKEWVEEAMHGVIDAQRRLIESYRRQYGP